MPSIPFAVNGIVQATGPYSTQSLTYAELSSSLSYPGSRGADKTANYTIVAADNGVLFSNAGATGAITFTLPAAIAKPASGAIYIFGFLVRAAQTLNVTAAGTDTIRIGSAGGVTAPGTLANTTIGSIVWIVNHDAGIWVALNASLGPWIIG